MSSFILCKGSKVIKRKSVKCPFRDKCKRYIKYVETNGKCYLIAPFEYSLNKYICSCFVENK